MINDTIFYNDKTFQFTGTFFGYDLKIYKHKNQRLLVDKKTEKIEHHYELSELHQAGLFFQGKENDKSRCF